MPVPKKRHSNTRTLRRSTNWKVKPVNYGSCPECGSEVLSPYRVFGVRQIQRAPGHCDQRKEAEKEGELILDTHRP